MLVRNSGVFIHSRIGNKMYTARDIGFILTVLARLTRWKIKSFLPDFSGSVALHALERSTTDQMKCVVSCSQRGALGERTPQMAGSRCACVVGAAVCGCLQYH
jgi:hypothetical protein